MGDVANSASSIKISEADFSTPEPTGTSSSSSFFKWIRYLLIIIILAFLGFNLFDYLGNITQWFVDTFGPPFKKIASSLGIAVGETTKTTINQSAQGTRAGIDIAAGTLTSGVDVLEKTLTGKSRESNLDNKQYTPNQPVPDDSGSKTQTVKNNKSGYCYIGDERGFRNCIKVTDQDKCMSGNIFPTMDVCINPSIRK